jgi:hypothetical protein
MPPKNLKVQIHKITELECKVTPQHFVANPGSEVTFEFLQEPNADIKFKGPSPFETPSVKPGAHIVKNEGKFEYDVKWRGVGNGNGTGEVIPV